MNPWKGLPPGSGFTRTRYEFRKDVSHFVIHDPGKRLRFCYGARPILVNLSGRGDKAMDYMIGHYGPGGEFGI